MLTKFFHGILLLVVIAGTTPRTTAYTATGKYANNSCINRVDEFELNTDTCSPSTCTATTWYGFPARMTMTCGVTSPADYAANVFGNDAIYFYMRVYSDASCTQESHVTGRRLYDGHCIGLGNASSVAYSLRTDTTLQTLVYSTPDCTGTTASVAQYSSNTIRSNSCIDKIKIYAHPGVYMSPQGHVTEIYYTDSTCTKPSWVQFKPVDVFSSSTAATCAQNEDGLYFTREQYLTFDNAATTSSIFASQTKAIFGSQTTYTTERGFHDSNCVADYGVYAYRADGKCINFGGVSGQFSILDDGTYFRTIYNSEDCSGGYISILRLPSSSLNTSVCQYSKKYYATFGETPAPTTQTPEATTQTVRTASSSAGAVPVAALMAVVATVAASVFLH